jgi:hypothetical protein
MMRGPGTAVTFGLTAVLGLSACAAERRQRDVSAAAERVPQPLVHSPVPFVEKFALSGDAVLLARKEGSRLTITRLPLRGGAAVRILSLPALGGLRVLSLKATDAVAGVTFTPDDDERGGLRSGLYGGAATEPLRELEPVRAETPDAYVPRSVEADGRLLFIGEVRRGGYEGRVRVRRADGSVQQVDVPRMPSRSSSPGI